MDSSNMEQLRDEGGRAVVQSLRNQASAERQQLPLPDGKQGERVDAIFDKMIGIASNMDKSSNVIAYNKLSELMDTSMTKAYENPPRTEEEFKQFYNDVIAGKNKILKDYHIATNSVEYPSEFNKLFNKGLRQVTSLYEQSSKDTMKYAVLTSLEPSINKASIDDMDIKLKDPMFVGAGVTALGGANFDKAVAKFYQKRLEQTMEAPTLSLDEKYAYVDNFKSIELTDDYKNSLKSKAFDGATKNMTIDLSVLGNTNPEVLKALQINGIADKNGNFKPLVQDGKLQVTLEELKGVIDQRAKEEMDRGKTIRGDTYLLQKFYNLIQQSASKDPKATAKLLGNYNITESSNILKNPTNTINNVVETFKQFGKQGVAVFTQMEMAQYNSLGWYDKNKVLQGIASDINNDPKYSEGISTVTDNITSRFVTPADKSLFTVNMLKESGGIMYDNWNINDNLQLAMDLSPDANQGANTLSNKTRQLSTYVRGQNYEKGSNHFWGREITKDKYALSKALNSPHNSSETTKVILGAGLKHASLDHNTQFDEDAVSSLLDGKHITVIGNAIVNGDATGIRNNIFRGLQQYNPKIDRQSVYDYGDLYRTSNGYYKYIDNKTGSVITFNKDGQQIRMQQ